MPNYVFVALLKSIQSHMNNHKWSYTRMLDSYRSKLSKSSPHFLYVAIVPVLLQSTDPVLGYVPSIHLNSSSSNIATFRGIVCNNLPCPCFNSILASLISWFIRYRWRRMTGLESDHFMRGPTCRSLPTQKYRKKSRSRCCIVSKFISILLIFLGIDWKPSLSSC